MIKHGFKIATEDRLLLLGAALVLLLLCAWPVQRACAQEDRPLPAAVQESTRADSVLHAFYRMRGFVPAWTRAGGGLTSAGRALVSLLRDAAREGLRPEDYPVVFDEQLMTRAAGASNSQQARYAQELRLARTGVQYARDLAHGRVDPRTLHAGWTLDARAVDLAGALQTLAAEKRAEAVQRLRPPHAGYDKLLHALQTHRRMAARGGWPRLPEGPALEPGRRHAQVPVLRRRLAASGDLPPRAAGDMSQAFSEALARAVRRFQRRHGLAPDGVVGPRTRVALNVPVEARIRQIERGLERWRWLPGDLGRRYWLVNLAACSLAVVERGEPVLAMRVIRGAVRTPTPVFTSRATHLVLAPYWYVPTSIARGEILPRLQRDPGYFARNGIERLSSGRLRQAPGPANPLGRLKFIVPNPFGIGLHDTPARHLFGRSICAFSHGCVRLEKPLALARYALQGDAAWTPARMDAVTARWETTRITLPEPIPVYVLYWTAWVDESGTTHFRGDAYGYDAALARRLRGGGGP